MNPLEWACLARDAYVAAPNLGPEDSAGRIVFVQSEQGLILTIPGTNNEACELADIKAWPTETDGCGACHAGIWEAFDAVWHDVSKLDVYALVGHSEGAAGAIYLAARLCLAGKPPKIVWAWEPPRTSIDSTLAEIFVKYGVELHIKRHGLDLVPDVPISLPDFPWQHAGKVEGFGVAAFPFPNIHDHMMAGIIADLGG